MTRGTTMAARIPKIITTTITSMRVKPEDLNERFTAIFDT
jgi:hypothetical protein